MSPLEIKDLAGLSEPFKKLIEVISQGVGNVYRPHLIRKTADARAYEIRQIAGAIHDARKLLGKADYANEEMGLVLTAASMESEQPLLAERATSRSTYREQVEQQNIEQITAQAAEELRDEKTVSEEAVDPDWISHFFDIARNISNEQMQLIWGQILAGEVKRPKSFSLRTLELLKNISQHEAETFVKVAKLAIHHGNSVFILYPDRGEFLAETFGIRFADLLSLQEIGLLNANDNLVIKMLATEKPITEVFVYGDIAIALQRPAGHPKFQFPIRGFTKIAQELLPLVNIEADIRYIQRFGSLLKPNETVVKYGTIVAREGDQLQIENVQEIV
jgi:hypothetical protein